MLGVGVGVGVVVHLRGLVLAEQAVGGAVADELAGGADAHLDTSCDHLRPWHGLIHTLPRMVALR